jgi:hypothetical protein
MIARVVQTLYPLSLVVQINPKPPQYLLGRGSVYLGMIPYARIYYFRLHGQGRNSISMCDCPSVEKLMRLHPLPHYLGFSSDVLVALIDGFLTKI